MDSGRQKLSISSEHIVFSYSSPLKKFLDKIEEEKQKLIEQGVDENSLQINTEAISCCSHDFCYCEPTSSLYLSGSRLENDEELERRLKILIKYEKLAAKSKKKKEDK